MSTLSDLAAELGTSTDALRTTLLAAAADEALTPTYLTVDAQGRVSANFTGRVKAAGLEIAAATTDDPAINDTDKRVYWTTASGAVVANIIGGESAPGGTDFAHLNAGKAGSQGGTNTKANTVLHSIDADGDSADLSTIVDGTVGAKFAAYVEAFVNATNNGATKTYARDIIRGDGSSDFVQTLDESLRIVRGNVTAVAGINAGSGFTVARTGGAPVGSYDVTPTAPFANDTPTILVTGNSAATPIAWRISAVGVGGAFTVQLYNSTTGALVDAGFRFAIIDTPT